MRSVDWDPDLLALFDIPLAALPKVMPSSGPFPAVRGLDPLPDGVPVFAVMGDYIRRSLPTMPLNRVRSRPRWSTGSSIMGLVDRAETRADTGLCLTIGWQLEHVAYAAEGNIHDPVAPPCAGW